MSTQSQCRHGRCGYWLRSAYLLTPAGCAVAPWYNGYGRAKNVVNVYSCPSIIRHRFPAWTNEPVSVTLSQDSHSRRRFSSTLCLRLSDAHHATFAVFLMISLCSPVSFIFVFRFNFRFTVRYVSYECLQSYHVAYVRFSYCLSHSLRTFGRKCHHRNHPK